MITKYHKFLHHFMMAKSNEMLKHGAPVVYYTGEDAKELFSWPESRAKKCAEQIDIYTRKSLISHRGLCGSSCPWCLTAKCDDCGYQARHGFVKGRPCSTTWLLLTDDESDDCLTESWYRETIAQLTEQFL